jgi:hypothetical protein
VYGFINDCRSCFICSRIKKDEDRGSKMLL